MRLVGRQVRHPGQLLGNKMVWDKNQNQDCKNGGGGNVAFGSCPKCESASHLIGNAMFIGLGGPC